MNKIALLVIDAQNDFCDHVVGSTLPVDGATEDLKRVSQFVKNVNPKTIFSSMDSHYSLDISHPKWWMDSKGNPIEKPLFAITSDDIKNGKYVPVIDPKASLAYVEALETQGEFSHFIWPEHCLIGTNGHNLHPIYFEALQEWSAKNRTWVTFINKGVHPYTEHFGIFRANIPNSDPNTQINQTIFNTLNNHDEIVLVGEARTHCVVNSLKQLLEISPALASKVIVLEDCMSNVPGLPASFYDYVDKLYADAKSKGVRFQKSTDF